jgi:hypothetical protein
MMIWAVTQHYADFDVQVQAALGPKALSCIGDAQHIAVRLFIHGLRPRQHGR